MAAQPVYRALKERVRLSGGEQPLLDRLASGETLTSIGRDFGVSRQLISKLLKRTPQLKVKYHEALRESAGAHADKSGEVLAVPPTASMPQVAAARNLSEHHRWMAIVTDRSTYGKPKEGQPVTIGELHLHALQATGRPQHQIADPTIGAEVVEPPMTPLDDAS